MQIRTKALIKNWSAIPDESGFLLTRIILWHQDLHIHPFCDCSRFTICARNMYSLCNSQHDRLYKQHFVIHHHYKTKLA